ncbi:MAG: 30S ribosomal protein S6 [Ignavibacteria bacterium]|nr:30S ribosomal protein S6 [Ignavibacteria bacterium]
MNRDYESYIIVDGNLEDASIEEIIKRYENLLKKYKAEIKNIDRIGRKRLAYPIKKKQNGYYVCFEFIAKNDVIAKLERAYRLDEDILRYLTIYMTKKELNAKKNYLEKRSKILENIEEAIKVNENIDSTEDEVPTE